MRIGPCSLHNTPITYSIRVIPTVRPRHWFTAASCRTRARNAGWPGHYCVGSRLMTHELKLLASSSRSRIEERRRASIIRPLRAGALSPLFNLVSKARARQPSSRRLCRLSSIIQVEQWGTRPLFRTDALCWSTFPPPPYQHYYESIYMVLDLFVGTRYDVTWCLVHFYTAGCSGVIA